MSSELVGINSVDRIWTPEVTSPIPKFEFNKYTELLGTWPCFGVMPRWPFEPESACVNASERFI